ncbi:esterase-like activity of phytase family protein [Falsiroseomonas sp. E2-1-a4]|uniref:esterase-like activity of phytase family protein n=1 Tax=Falsiroseomonas sp. E2-1-a4 TaxID=3239299 RepID=UPI003F2E9DFB
MPGDLRLLGGLQINTGVLGFGGLSGLHMTSELMLTAISDLGHFVEMALTLDEDWRPRRLDLVRSGPLRNTRGQPVTATWRDAEALARLPDGSWLIGFERRHRIQRHRRLDGPGELVLAPPGLERSPRNAALESLAVLPDGRWLALSEGLAAPQGGRMGWIGQPCQWRSFGYLPAAGHVPVDAAAMPDGGFLVLERSFGLLAGFAGRLVRLSPAVLRAAAAGGVIEGEPLMDLVPPLPTDNYEGVAVTEREGRVLVALVSDDNESIWQRSLLLLFEMPL